MQRLSSAIRLALCPGRWERLPGQRQVGLVCDAGLGAGGGFRSKLDGALACMLRLRHDAQCNARRLLLRTAVVAGVVGAALVAPRITIQALPAPPVASSLALSFQDAGSDNWETPPIEATATVAGISWEGDPPRRAWVRASEDGSEWSPWTELLVDAEHGPDPGTAEAAGARPASEPVYVGKANWLQYRVEGAEPGRVKAEVVETAGRQLGVLERAALVVRGIRLSDAEQAGASPTSPTFITREEWGAESCEPADPSPPAYITRVRGSCSSTTPPPPTDTPRRRRPR